MTSYSRITSGISNEQRFSQLDFERNQQVAGYRSEPFYLAGKATEEDEVFSERFDGKDECSSPVEAIVLLKQKVKEADDEVAPNARQTLEI